MPSQALLLFLASTHVTALTAAAAVQPRQGGNGHAVLGTLSTWTAPGCGAGTAAQAPVDLVLLYAFQCEALPGGVAAAALADAGTGIAYHVNVYPEPGCEGDYLTLDDAVCADAELMPGQPPRWAAYQVVMPPINLAGSMGSMG